MNTESIILAVAIVLLVIVLVAVSRLVGELRRLRGGQEHPSALLVVQNQLDGLREQVRASLEGGRQEIDLRLQETNRVVGEVQRGLGEVDRQVRSVGDAARDLRGLQELLRSPKVRGGMGEQLLAELLAQVLPQAHFALQMEFQGGERVDAVVQLGERMVPIDAKFPLENFRRMRHAAETDDTAAERSARRAFRSDVRRHVDAIAKRYIRPHEGTYEFAMMYLPAEAVFQELIHQDGEDGLDVFHYALTRHVVPVSPQSFYAYLQVIVLGLRGMTIESRAREIMDRLAELRTRLAQFGESFEVAGRHLGNAQRQMEEAGRRLGRLEAALEQLTEGPRPTAGRAAETPRVPTP